MAFAYLSYNAICDNLFMPIVSATSCHRVLSLSVMHTCYVMLFVVLPPCHACVLIPSCHRTQVRIGISNEGSRWVSPERFHSSSLKAFGGMTFFSALTYSQFWIPSVMPPNEVRIGISNEKISLFSFPFRDSNHFLAALKNVELRADKRTPK